jgi:hypothetical protein
MKKALVTFVIGDHYKKSFELFRPSVLAYCEKHGWDFKELTEPLDTDKTSDALYIQKLLIVNQPWSKEYEYIAWIDSDIWITDTCPDIELPPPGLIGLTKECIVNDSIHSLICQRRGWVCDGIASINAGLMVFSIHDADYLRNVYNDVKSYIATKSNVDINGNKPNHDQNYLSHRFWKDDKIHFMDWRYNVVWPNYRCAFVEPYESPQQLIKPMCTLMDLVYMVHFTDREDIQILDVYKRIRQLHGKDVIVPKENINSVFTELFRLFKFRNVYIDSDEKPMCPMNQFGYVYPKNIIRWNNQPGLSLKDVDAVMNNASSEGA